MLTHTLSPRRITVRDLASGKVAWNRGLRDRTAVFTGFTTDGGVAVGYEEPRATGYTIDRWDARTGASRGTVTLEKVAASGGGNDVVSADSGTIAGLSHPDPDWRRPASVRGVGRTVATADPGGSGRFVRCHLHGAEPRRAIAGHGGEGRFGDRPERADGAETGTPVCSGRPHHRRRRRERRPPGRAGSGPRRCAPVRSGHRGRRSDGRRWRARPRRGPSRPVRRGEAGWHSRTGVRCSPEPASTGRCDCGRR